MDRENAPFFTQGARSRVSFGAANESRLFEGMILRDPAGIAFGGANGPRRAGQKSLPALCNLLPGKMELSMKGILEVDILGKVSYTKIIAKASIAAHAGGDAQTAK